MYNYLYLSYQSGLSRQTAMCLGKSMEIYEGHNAVMRKSLDQFGKFDISQDEFFLHFGNEKVNPSWVHLFRIG